MLTTHGEAAAASADPSIDPITFGVTLAQTWLVARTLASDLLDLDDRRR
jgi:hypothetical protein